jgi:sarcosine oxidase subunit gamma
MADAAAAAAVAAAPVLRSPLGEVFARPRQADGLRVARVHVAEWADIGCLVLRGRAGDAAFMAAVSAALGLSLPTQPSTYAAAARCIVLWLSPDEWWLLLPRAERDATLAALQAALAGVFAQVVDNSGGLACLRLAGPEHLSVLRHLGPYDFEANLTIGRCVSSVIPKAGVTVVRSDDDGVMLVFRRSFADWVWRLLERSARPYGLALCSPAQLPARDFSALLDARTNAPRAADLPGSRP